MQQKQTIVNNIGGSDLRALMNCYRLVGSSNRGVDRFTDWLSATQMGTIVA
jgi:hypothetical protein